MVRTHARVARVLVIDDGSDDDTAGTAAAVGVSIEAAYGSRPGHPCGKGSAMSTALTYVQTDFVIFLDADVTDPQPWWIDALLRPLDDGPHTVLAKAHYRRPLTTGTHIRADEGGRVNALLARPLLQVLAPDLAFIQQPLSGECAARTEALRHVTLEPGYAVEIGLLLDIADLFGAHAIAQADLGTRTHRNRPLVELERHAEAILEAALRRHERSRARQPDVARIA